MSRNNIEEIKRNRGGWEQNEDEQNGEHIAYLERAIPLAYIGRVPIMFKQVGNALVAVYIKDDGKNELGVFTTRPSDEFHVVEDKYSIYSNLTDISLISENSVVGVMKMNNDHCDVVMLSKDVSLMDVTYQIKEIKDIRFTYPYLGMIKGCNEIFVYDYTREKHVYLHLNSPIL